MTDRGHKRAKTALMYERAHEVWSYEPETGLLRWKIKRQGTKGVGSIAGWRQRGLNDYWCIEVGIDGERYKAHRVIWLMQTGEWPEFEVDHEDRDGLNNRWTNLRHATSSQNQANRSMQRNNTSGYKGAFFHKQTGRWKAAISIRRVQRHLGLFDTPEEAHAAYAAAAATLHGAFGRTD